LIFRYSAYHGRKESRVYEKQEEYGFKAPAPVKISHKIALSGSAFYFNPI
jgi:hypothetical protein